MRAILLLLIGLAGCRAPLVIPDVVDSVSGAVSRAPDPAKPNPPDPKKKKDDDEPPPPQAPPRDPPRREEKASKKGAPPKGEMDAEPQDAADDTWRPRRSTATALASSSGERPDPGEPEGQPAVRKPDGDQMIPPGAPVKYLSPAPLRALGTGKQAPLAPSDGGDPGDDLAEEGAGARRPAYPPPATAMLDDALPEMGIGDPDAIGSYHVQIASTAAFSKVLFDKVYPFMGEIDLAKDLEGAPASLDTLWLRYALVDLLDFQHPYTRPRRIVRKAAPSGGTAP